MRKKTWKDHKREEIIKKTIKFKHWRHVRHESKKRAENSQFRKKKCKQCSYTYTLIMWFDATYRGKKPIQTNKKEKKNWQFKQCEKRGEESQQQSKPQWKKCAFEEEAAQKKASETFSVAKKRLKAGDMWCSQRMQWHFNCIFLRVFDWNESENFMGSKRVYNIHSGSYANIPIKWQVKCPASEINGCPMLSFQYDNMGKSVKQENSLKSQLHRIAPHLKNDLSHRNGHTRHTSILTRNTRN